MWISIYPHIHSSYIRKIAHLQSVYLPPFFVRFWFFFFSEIKFSDRFRRGCSGGRRIVVRRWSIRKSGLRSSWRTEEGQVSNERPLSRKRLISAPSMTMAMAMAMVICCLRTLIIIRRPPRWLLRQSELPLLIETLPSLPLMPTPPFGLLSRTDPRFHPHFDYLFIYFHSWSMII